MKKWIILVFVLSVIGMFSQISLGRGIEYTPYDEMELRDMLKEWTPEGWHNAFLQAEQLDKARYEENLKDYIIWGIQNTNSLPKLLNQIFIFDYSEGVLQLLWKSDIFEGEILTFNFEDTDNNGTKNINLFLIEEQENRKIISYLRSYDWNGNSGQLVYPQSYLPIIAGDFIDVRCSGYEYKIALTTFYDEGPFYRKIEYYLFKNGTINLNYVETIPREKSKLAEVEEKSYPDKQDAPFVDFLQANNFGGLLMVYDLHYDDLYVLMLEIESFEQLYDIGRYLVVKKEGDLITFLYRLDRVYNDLTFVYMDSQDINDDGYAEVLLGETSGGVSLSYIFSLLPHTPQLISPIVDMDDIEFDSGRYVTALINKDLSGPMFFEDIDDDGVPELGTNTEYDHEFAIQYWLWDDQQRTYTRYKMLLWDKTTNESTLVDNSAL